MARNNNLWFEFAGASSTDNKVKLLALPARPRATLRVPDAPVIPGRDGALWLPEDTYDEIEIPVRAQLLSGASPVSISAWLTGRGLLRFSDATARAYRARALAAYAYEHIDGCAARQIIEMTFACHPCAYHYPAASAVLTSGTPITNPGTRYAEPKITIVGSGDIDLTIGDQTLTVTGMDTGCAIDMEARVAYQGSVNMGPQVSGDWPLLIQPGSNAVSWTATGTITSVTIEPHWRDI